MPYRLIENPSGSGILFSKATGQILTTCRYRLWVHIEVLEVLGQPDVDGFRSITGHLFDAADLINLLGEQLVLELEEGTRGIDCFVTSTDNQRGDSGPITCSGNFYERGLRVIRSE